MNPKTPLPKHRDIRLHHYFVKNKLHFQEKVDKGMADRVAKRDMEEFYYCDRNEVFNDDAIKVWDAIRLIKKQS